MNYSELGMDSILSFGKHKGQQIEDVLEDDPQYLLFLHEQYGTEFDAEVLEALEYI